MLTSTEVVTLHKGRVNIRAAPIAFNDVDDVMLSSKDDAAFDRDHPSTHPLLVHLGIAQLWVKQAFRFLPWSSAPAFQGRRLRLAIVGDQGFDVSGQFVTSEERRQTISSCLKLR